ncbi:MAG: bifunctional diaminohydroxyphosphoribosylaminopyrimidine deaminase/5-amino-6-(5-phosphoribosylamino)uracil reductase RibD [Candidatus Peregrinibacteria bacterium]|nr:bifunctional diaminohydroxyphosphoribosylaminopyrimidine deaminase/5-amino-6-(5-phosphoribosylamino)uracil reductase RibD [Candidatus Peregrinibacteria bacterium]
MDEVFMRRAIELAKKREGFTSPNPCVGAVIVKGGQIVAEGWHEKAGADHAEIMAIKQMMQKSGIMTVDIEPMLFHNATLYVTLEPCAHTGKTPPCVKAVATAGFSKVVIGMKDPFQKVNGKGISYLKKHGIKVSVLKPTSKLAEEVRSINQPFIKNVTLGLPYLTLKAGLSLDGKIATFTKDSRWITCEKSRLDAKLERSKCDAVIIGASTVMNDNPELATIGEYKSKNILRVIVGDKLDFKKDMKIFRDENVLIACSDNISLRLKKKLIDASVSVKSFGKSKVVFKKLLKYLASNGIQSVFVEGGSGINGSLFDENLSDSKLVDRVLFYYAPKLVGGTHSLSIIGGAGIAKISDSIDVVKSKFDILDGDLKYEGLINFY